MLDGGYYRSYRKYHKGYREDRGTEIEHEAVVGDRDLEPPGNEYKGQDHNRKIEPIESGELFLAAEEDHRDKHKAPSVKRRERGNAYYREHSDRIDLPFFLYNEGCNDKAQANESRPYPHYRRHKVDVYVLDSEESEYLREDIAAATRGGEAENISRDEIAYLNKAAERERWENYHQYTVYRATESLLEALVLDKHPAEYYGIELDREGKCERDKTELSCHLAFAVVREREHHERDKAEHKYVSALDHIQHGNVKERECSEERRELLVVLIHLALYESKENESEKERRYNDEHKRSRVVYPIVSLVKVGGVVNVGRESREYKEQQICHGRIYNVALRVDGINVRCISYGIEKIHKEVS